MAPFGRNFLKARLKNRSENKEPLPGKEVQVWVCQEEKVVCGVTKHSTCADVVQALLEDHQSSAEGKVLLGEPSEYCLLERWKGFERALPPLTRILRLWNAWGDEKPFVQFILVKAGESRPPPCKGSSRPKGAPSKPRSAAKRRDQAPAQYVRSLPVERQRRMVKKAFRKLERFRERERRPVEEGRIGGLVQLIIEQDHTIREQVHRMRELDVEIERIERGLGLGGGASAPERDGALCPDLSEPAEIWLQEDLYGADGVERLEAQLERHRDLIERLSHDIDAELKSVWHSTGADELRGATASAGPDPEDPAGVAELETLRKDLEHSMQRGLSLHAQVTDLEKELQRNDAALSSKSRECEQLAAQLSSLQVSGTTERVGPPSPTDQSQICGSQGKLCQILSRLDGTDTDSDTGISSTHSQDSLSPCRDILPPLDTDV
ncbi:ras association domain-containing protein 9-like [Megalops cyprinoides]|uniref:ras association domain-containing protein 9-like n=1 Tax=Megalops cyprinoides TaxID=118141 RepID=UPI001863DBB9|nr:ras association domain-containing protein 9-like [Megalops cyprinoides]